MSTPHGTISGYRHHGCRCQPCRQATYRDNKLRLAGLVKDRLIDATGTRRRIHALYRMGWDSATLADRLGCKTPEAVSVLTKRRKVNVRTATKVARLYDELAMTVGPSEQARKLATTRGLPGPLAWDDDTIDDPAAAPDLGQADRSRSKVPLDDLEHLLDTAGPWTWDRITTRLGVTRSAIEHACSPRRGNRPDLLHRIRAGTDASREAHHRGTAA